MCFFILDFNCSIELLDKLTAAFVCFLFPPPKISDDLVGDPVADIFDADPDALLVDVVVVPPGVEDILVPAAAAVLGVAPGLTDIDGALVVTLSDGCGGAKLLNISAPTCPTVLDTSLGSA